jgi:hypothetical protein
MQNQCFLFFILCHMSLGFLLGCEKLCVFHFICNRNLCQNVCQKHMNVVSLECTLIYKKIHTPKLMLNTHNIIIQLAIGINCSILRIFRFLKWTKN